MIKRIGFFVLCIIVVACKSTAKDGEFETDKNGYTVEKYDTSGLTTKSLTFMLWDSVYNIAVKHDTKGDYKIADTSGKHITLYREDYVQITVNGKNTLITKDLFDNYYQNKKDLYHSCFGKVWVDKVDIAHNVITFKTIFGYHKTSGGDTLVYNITPGGKFEFVDVRPIKKQKF